ncbi:MAG TPA: hypothetical protein GXZ57_06845 [Acholeplasmataceae bacterium]|nr:hypothetical protein [Acholeplasmataceae bacterium]
MNNITKAFFCFSLLCLIFGGIFMYNGFDSNLQDQSLKEVVLGGFLFLSGTIALCTIYFSHRQKS